MPATSPSRVHLASYRRGLHWLGEVRMLRNRPRVHCRRVHEALADLAGYPITPPVRRRVAARICRQRLHIAAGCQ